LSGLVLELQSDALNSNIPVSELLRKALVVSKKLGVSNIEEWLNNELNGYGLDSDIPPYREVRGQVKVWNPYQGWKPLNLSTSEEEEELSKQKVAQTVGELDSINTKMNMHEGYLQVPFPQDQVNWLISRMNIPLQPTLFIPQSAVVKILDTVRTIILNFALQLEQDGIWGEGMSFSKEEKNTASQHTYNTTYNIGSMQNSQIQQHSTGPQTLNVNNELRVLTEFLSKLVSCLDSLELQEDSKNELLAEVATVESQAKSPRPKRAIISESLKSIRIILEGATGSILASELLPELAKLAKFLTG
jgi:AbiTii